MWTLVAAVVGLAAWFGYSVWANHQAELQADASYRLVVALQEQVRKDPNNAILRVRLGEALGASGRYPQAAEQLNAALKIEPKHIGAYLDLGLLAMVTEDYGSASKYFEKVVELAGESQYGGIDKRKETAYFHLGEIALLDEEYEQAAGYFKESLRMRSDASDTYYKLAEALVGLGDDQGAMDNLEIALTFDPGFAPAHFLMGNLQKDQGDDVNASYHFQRAAELAPDVEMAQDALASYGPSEEWLAKARSSFGEGDIEKTLEFVLVARNLDPESFEAAKFHAEVLVKRGDTKDALEVYKKALEIEPDDAQVKAQVKALQAKVDATKK